MSTHITTQGATDIGPARAILLQFNSSITATVTIATAGSTQYGTSSGTVAIITNPTLGQPYRYGGLMTQGDITISLSGTSGDFTVTKVNQVG